jgi:uncharacterized low-complexity protein
VNLMNTRTLAAALAGATLFGLTAQAAPKTKPKANPAVTVTVTVTNSRKADLVQLEAAKSGSADWKKVVGPVKSGKQASAKLPPGALPNSSASMRLESSRRLADIGL